MAVASSTFSLRSYLLPPNSSSSPLSFGTNLQLPRGWTLGYTKLRGTNNSRSRFCALLQGGADDSEEEDEYYDAEEEEDVGEMESPDEHKTWDILGLGQAMVDFSGMVDDEFLEKLNIEKGTRKVINHEERGRFLREMDGSSYKAAAGGSLSNTLVALARLGGGRVGGPHLKVAMAGSIGSDPLGSFFRMKLRRANVRFLSKPVKDGTTGTVIVLTTPDAQRTMLAYQGTSSTVNYDTSLANLVSKTKILIVEGYLFEFPHTIEAIKKACQDAHKNGAMIAVTASDVSCIKRCYDDFWDVIGNYADILFANVNEARALSNSPQDSSPLSITTNLSRTIPLVSITDGPQGSYLSQKGEEPIFIPASNCVPIDTCGAGDSYASGILYGVLRGVSELKGLGGLASRVASVVVGQQGTRLKVCDADRFAQLFEFDLQRLRTTN